MDRLESAYWNMERPVPALHEDVEIAVSLSARGTKRVPVYGLGAVSLDCQDIKEQGTWAERKKNACNLRATISQRVVAACATEL